MSQKPLSAYRPGAPRSLLAKPTIVMPYKNASQVVIGDRASQNKNHFMTVNRQFQLHPDMSDATTNSGIIAARNKWIHKHQL